MLAQREQTVGVSLRQRSCEVVPERFLRNGSLMRESSKKRCSPLKKLSALFRFKKAKSGGTAFPRPDIRMGDFFIFPDNNFLHISRKRGSKNEQLQRASKNVFSL